MDKDQISVAVRNWLDDCDLNYTYDSFNFVITMDVPLNCKLGRAKYFIQIKDNCYVVYLYSPISCVKDNLAELNRFLTMANYGLVHGNFELDLRDGEIRFKVTVFTMGLNELPTESITESIWAGIAMMERYGDGIAAVALGFADADTEIAKAEPQEDADNESEDGNDGAEN